MIAEVEQADGTFVDEEREPRCGDFCDRCGDCLKCSDEDSCVLAEDERHRFVVYTEPWD